MYPTAFLDYMIYFHVERDYFECHEVLEEHWKQQPSEKRQPHWVGLIQIAVGLYHHRRENFNGAFRMYNKALNAVMHQPAPITKLGIDVASLIDLLEEQIKLVQNPKQPFSDFNLPINDSNLIELCKKRCEQLGMSWRIQNSSHLDESLIHKHCIRNRDDVIEERLQQLQLRQQKRQ